MLHEWVVNRQLTPGISPANVRVQLQRNRHLKLYLINTHDFVRRIKPPRDTCAVPLTPQASRRASLAQGAGLLRAAQAMFPLGDECGGIISKFRGLVRGGSAAISEGETHLMCTLYHTRRTFDTP